MAEILRFLFEYLTHLAADRRAATAAQAQQQPAQSFAAAWNAGQLRLPSSFLYDVTDPVSGATATAAPWCDAAIDDAGCLRIALSVPPDAPFDAATMTEHVEAVRQLARTFFQVGLRLMDAQPYQRTLQLVLAPVRPQADASGAILLGYDDTGAPVATRFIGEVTAVSGCDAWCLPWLGASYAAIDQQTLDPATAIASTRAAIRQARAGADLPYMMVDVGDAACAENTRPERIRDLVESRRGIVEWSRGDVPSDAWAIRPTQCLRRSGTVYTLERAGRKIMFAPAWLY